MTSVRPPSEASRSFTSGEWMFRRARVWKPAGSMPTGKLPIRVWRPFRAKVICRPDDFEHRHLAVRVAILGDEVANEIAGIAVGLEAHHVVLQQQRDELLVVGQASHHLRRRHRNVEKEADPVGVAAASQRVGDRDQVIVVHPDQVVGLDDPLELGREMIVDPHVAGEVAPRELGEVEAEVEDRPQHPVGEAVVIFLVVVVERSVTT